MWGPDPPSVISLRHRIAELKKLGMHTKTIRVRTSKTTENHDLPTPFSSPKANKREHSYDDDESLLGNEATQRRQPKRKATQKAKQYQMVADEGGDEQDGLSFKAESDDDPSEYTPVSEDDVKVTDQEDMIIVKSENDLI